MGDEPDLAIEKPIKKTKKKKKKDKEVKEEKSGIIIDEDRIEQLMKEHKAKKEREAMGITDETSGLLEENNTKNYFETINNLYDKKDAQEPIIIEKRERDSTDLKEAEELFEAIDPKATMDEELEAMLKWQEEQEEEERLEREKRKERLAEKQQLIEQEAEKERIKREEEKRKEDEERKKKMEDLKAQEEEREKKMVLEKAKKEREI